MTERYGRLGGKLRWPTKRIRFNKPSLEGNELAYIQTAVETGHTSCSGPFAAAAGELLRDWLGAPDVLLTTSCTAALEMSALLLDLEPGDTVVVPSFTFTSHRARVRPRRAPSSSSATSSARRSASTPSTSPTLLDDTVRAVVPVHYAGVACDMDGIRECRRPAATSRSIEDNAHGLFGR